MYFVDGAFFPVHTQRLFVSVGLTGKKVTNCIMNRGKLVDYIT